MRIGILALQGAFIEHAAMLSRLGAEPRQVRLPDELADLDALIIPGGESTTIGKLAIHFGLVEPLKAFAARHPMWGVCAGLIFMARDIGGLEQPLLGVMDVVVERNAFGRQIDSFETDLPVPALNGHSPALGTRPQPSGEPFHAIFIRGPVIRSVGPDVQVLAALPDRRIVAARQRNLLATAFHPELSGDPRFHRYFLDMLE
jgi:pyridoxal 5'-phosphate synthase pdxT subunit